MPPHPTPCTHCRTHAPGTRAQIGYWLSEAVQGDVEKVYHAHPLPEDLLKVAVLQWNEVAAPATPDVGWELVDPSRFGAATNDASSSRRRALREQGPGGHARRGGGRPLHAGRLARAGGRCRLFSWRCL